MEAKAVTENDLKYYNETAKEDYARTPVSVLRYIIKLEEALSSSPTETDHCVWTLKWYDGQYYSTGCNEAFSFEYDDYVKDSGFKFCQFCGKEIEEINEVVG